MTLVGWAGKMLWAGLGLGWLGWLGLLVGLAGLAGLAELVGLAGQAGLAGLTGLTGLAGLPFGDVPILGKNQASEYHAQNTSHFTKIWQRSTQHIFDNFTLQSRSMRPCNMRCD